jgi:redox-sensitive bicupin YhaK (pirin superfamily)
MNRLVLDAGHWVNYDPFLFVTEDSFLKGNFHFHPHCGLETVTTVLEGRLQFDDTHGATWLMSPGDAQWTTTGHGVVHNEQPPEDGEPVHTLQFWVNLPVAKKRIQPRYQNLRAGDLPVIERPGIKLRVYSGSLDGARAPTENHVPVTLADIRVEADAELRVDLPGRYNAFLYLLEGSGRFGAKSTPAKAGQVLRLQPLNGAAATDLVIRADERLRTFLFAGEPIGERPSRPAYTGNAAQMALAYADADDPVGEGEDIVKKQMTGLQAHSLVPQVMRSSDWASPTR